MEDKKNFTLLMTLKKKECIDIIYKNIDEETLKNWLFDENNKEEQIKKLIDKRFDKLTIKDFIYEKQYNLIDKESNKDI